MFKFANVCTVGVQWYASTCNYIVNLRHSWFGIDYFNILEGPSNGFEMINFSEESLRVESSSGERRWTFTTDFSRKTSCA